MSVCLIVACAGEAPERDSTEDPLRGAFAGREACAGCHSAIASTFSHTGMGRSFHRLTASSAVEDFEARNRLELREAGLAYTMTARDGRYWMRQDVLGPDGEVLASLEKEMIWVVGSGNHSRSYLTGANGLLFQMPVCWYPGKPGWDLCPGYERSNSYFNRRADDACLSCHNAWMVRDPARPERYAATQPEGIDCERCHGPGALHVARWRDPTAEPGDGEGTIVNPLHLPAATRMDVCAQCHLGGAEATWRLLRAGRGFTDFRPGEEIAGHLEVVARLPLERGSFSLNGQVERLMQSRCWSESGGAVDCLTCHDPHVTVYAEDRPEDHFRKACLGCHAAEDCRVDESERRRRVPADDCTACHMRRGEPTDQRFTTFTDHWIRARIDDAGAPSRGGGGPGRFGALLGDEEGAARGSERSLHLGTAAFLHGSQTGAESHPDSWDTAEQHLREAIEDEPDLAQAWRLLGEISLGRGNPSRAIGYFREAASRDPGEFLARRSLGAALLDLGRPREALESLEEARSLAPLDVATRTQIGRALVMLEEEDGARRLFEEILSDAPDDPSALANAGLLAARSGRNDEAVELLRRAGAADPGEPRVWHGLASSLRRLGRHAEAAGAAGRAERLEALQRAAASGSPPAKPRTAATSSSRRSTSM